MNNLSIKIDPNTYPIPENINIVINYVKNNFLETGTSYLNCIDIETIRELNALCHQNILLFNIVRNEYILKRFVTVLLYNFGYENGDDFSVVLENEKNIQLLKFIKDIIKVANITFVDESTKKIYLRTKFVKYGLTPQKNNHIKRANLEFDILKKLSENNISVFNWLHNKTILDIGCGSGHFLGELFKNNVTNKNKLHGIDVEFYVEPEYQNLITHHKYDHHMKFPSNFPKFDFVSFFMAIHHISLYNLHIILTQLYSVLANDGYLYIKEHLVECQDDVTFFKFMETYFYFIEEYIPNIPVEDNYFTTDGLIKVFEIYGFENKKFFEIDKSQPFKPFYYLFQKNINYDTTTTSDEKLEKLKNIIEQMTIQIKTL